MSDPVRNIYKGRFVAKEKLDAAEQRIALLEAAARTLLNAEIDRWAAGTERQSAEANAAHESAHDALAALLQEQEK
jgi:hypothetical protein